MTTSEPVLHLRGASIRASRPAVCVPLVAADPAGVRDAAAALPPGVADVVELRLDHLTGAADDTGVVSAAVTAARGALPDDVPLLATFRSAREGGVQPAGDDAYAAVVAAVAAGAGTPDGADAVDVELAAPGAADLVAHARAAGLAVVVSHHDFAATPPADALLDVLRRQRAVGADVCKVAVMPHDPDDVLALLAATREFARGADRPVVTVAMGRLGLVTRLAGGVFGSAMTFASVGTASAPGQVDAAVLREVLPLLHSPDDV